MVMQKQTTWSLDEFSLWLQEQQLSRRSISCYVSRVTQFLKYADRLDTSFIGDELVLKEQIELFMGHCLIDLRMSERSVNSMLTAVNSYLRFLNRQVQKKERLSAPEKLPPVLTLAQESAIRLAIQRTHSSKFRAIVVLFLYAGLRMDEVRQLFVHDLIFDGKQHGFVAVATERNRREIPLDEHVGFELQKWLLLRSSSNIQSEFLFPNHSGQSMSIASMDYVVRTVARQSKLNVSAIVLRNTFIANVIQTTSNMDEVRKLTGIKRLDALSRYQTMARLRLLEHQSSILSTDDHTKLAFSATHVSVAEPLPITGLYIEKERLHG